MPFYVFGTKQSPAPVDLSSQECRQLHMKSFVSFDDLTPCKTLNQLPSSFRGVKFIHYLVTCMD